MAATTVPLPAVAEPAAQAPADEAKRTVPSPECQYVRGGPARIEGFDGPDTFGVQLIVRDGSWVWQRAPSGVIAMCPRCRDDEVANGLFRFGRAPFLSPVQEGDLRGETGQQDAGPMEFALHPRAIAMALWRITTLLPSKVDAQSDIEPVDLWGMKGLAREVEVTTAGRTVPSVAFALEERCFAMFGIFLRKDERKVSVADLLKTGASISILKYQPVRHELSPAIHFPLGNARKRWEDDMK
jgi:hypothetical protein